MNGQGMRHRARCAGLAAVTMLVITFVLAMSQTPNGRELLKVGFCLYGAAKMGAGLGWRILDLWDDPEGGTA